MITKTILQWLGIKWQEHTEEHLKSYSVFVMTVDGQRVLQHLMDTVYCTVYEGVDPQGAIINNARRSVVHDILMNIHMLQQPAESTLPDLSSYEKAIMGVDNGRVV